jgi:hypothetical protein
MIARRDVITGAALGGSVGTILPHDAEAGTVDDKTDQILERLRQEIVKAVDDLRRELVEFWELAPVREQQKTFLRATGKFPDFLEVGSDVWQRVYDWHVRYRAPITLGRTGEGRYTILLMTTTIIMRPDLAPGHVGFGYDNR